MFFAGGDEGPRLAHDELRRHVYRHGGKPIRIKVKRSHGFANWYRVSDRACEGWQAGKPEGYQERPYIGAIDLFDRELGGDVLYWPEGEKDVDTLTRHALPAFTFGGTGDGLPAGAGEFTRGRHLIILTDNDQAGRDHAAKKAGRALGLAASIKVIEFPELQAGGDVTDYLNNHSIDELQHRIDDARNGRRRQALRHRQIPRPQQHL